MTTDVCKVLGIKRPIIQGPMFWLTNAKFVAAVSNAGGLGVLGINAGQYEPTKSLEVTLEHIKDQIHQTRELTDQPFGLNLVLSDDPEHDVFTGPTIELMAAEHVPVAVIYATKYIPKWFDMLKQKGIKIVYRPATPTKMVVADAVERGVDVIVATGFDEGGTIPDKVVGTFSAVPLVVDVVAGRVPVLAAGGIVDERTTKAAMALGANGVFVGTALLATNESPMADNIKEQLIKLDANDQLMFRALPAYYRSIPGKLPNHLVELDKAGKSNSEIWHAAGNYSGMRTGMLLGDLDHGYASFGLGMTFIDKIEPVKTVMDRLVAGIQ